MKTTKTIIHRFRKSRPNDWLNAMKRKRARILPDSIRLDGVRCIGVCMALVFVFSLNVACSSHHYFSINAEEITNPSIMYSDSTSLTNPF